MFNAGLFYTRLVFCLLFVFCVFVGAMATNISSRRRVAGILVAFAFIAFYTFLMFFSLRDPWCIRNGKYQVFSSRASHGVAQGVAIVRPLYSSKSYDIYLDGLKGLKKEDNYLLKPGYYLIFNKEVFPLEMKK